MGLEHEIEEVIEKSIVKSVEKLISKGLIEEIVQITIDTIAQNVYLMLKDKENLSGDIVNLFIKSVESFKK